MMHETGSVVQDFRDNKSMSGYDIAGRREGDLFTRQLRGNSHQPHVTHRFRAAVPLFRGPILAQLSTCFCRMEYPCVQPRFQKRFRWSDMSSMLSALSGIDTWRLKMSKKCSELRCVSPRPCRFYHHSPPSHLHTHFAHLHTHPLS